ncbi:MAG: prephenate dehydrogenase/arogenate dehydrogenase family protein [Candidatus Bathycorpusculaceae bacterium]
MKAAIIGAGKMGTWFTKFFLEEGYSVIVSDKDRGKLLKIENEFPVETADAPASVKNADIILVCVPIDDFEDVIKEIRSNVGSGQVIMDICSIKEPPVKIMHKHIKRGIVLGMHPVFGPGSTSVKNKNFILTPTSSEERKLAEDFKVWLEGKEAHVSIMSPRKHDELMSIVLGLPHFIGLVACDILLDQSTLSETRRVAGASYKMLLTLAEAVASEKADFYADLQLNLPSSEQIESLFIAKSEEWLKVIKNKNRLALISKIEDLKAKMIKIDPEYSNSYEAMYRMLEAVES